MQHHYQGAEPTCAICTLACIVRQPVHNVITIAESIIKWQGYRSWHELAYDVHHPSEVNAAWNTVLDAYDLWWWPRDSISTRLADLDPHWDFSPAILLDRTRERGIIQITNGWSRHIVAYENCLVYDSSWTVPAMADDWWRDHQCCGWGVEYIAEERR